MGFQTRQSLANWLLGLFLLVSLYAGYDLLTGFSLLAVGAWGVGLLAFLLVIGAILPDWSKIGEVKPLFEEIHDLLQTQQQTVFARELEEARQKLFDERDRASRSSKLLEKVPLEAIEKELSETRESLASAPPERHPLLSSRLEELEQTQARLQENKRIVSEFEEIKKSVLISLQHLRVRLESGGNADQTTDGLSVEDGFRQIHGIMDRVQGAQAGSPTSTVKPAAQGEERVASPEDEGKVPPREPERG